jgi:hypothetical protein
MPRYILQKSTRKDKKWMVIGPDGTTIHFGQEGYQDFTDHGDERRRASYLAGTRKMRIGLRRVLTHRDFGSMAFVVKTKLE